MRISFRQTAFVSTALLALGAVPVLAAPPGAKDPTVTPSTAPGGPPAAQPAPVNGAGQMPAANGDEASGNAANPEQSMQAMVEQRITELHSKLGITPAEEADWNKFAQTMRNNAKNMDQAFDSRLDDMDKMNALDNMKSYARLASEHARDVQALLPPFQALYAKMTPSQKQTADQVFREDANRGGPGATPAQHG